MTSVINGQREGITPQPRQAPMASLARERFDWLPIEGGLLLNATASAKCWKLIHTDYAFCVVRSGTADWRYRRRAFTVQQGSVYVLEPGEVHTTVAAHTPGDYSVYFLDPQWIARLSEELGFGSTPHFVPQGLALPQHWRALLQLACFDAKKRAGELSEGVTAVVSSLLRSTSPRAPQPQLSNDVLARARATIREWFEANPNATVSIRAISKQLNVGYHTLIHEFSRRYSAAPYEYVGLLRVRLALTYLRQGPTHRCSSLTAVAHCSGYSDAAHMTRTFRKHLGTTPSALAKQIDARWAQRRKITEA